MKRRTGAVASLLALAMARPADATVSARLDRDHIAVGGAVTLVISADGSQARPDLSPLRRDFQVQGIATGSQTTIVNGSMHSSLQWSITLMPTHAGLLDVPALAVGSEKTAPMKVMVDGPGGSTAAGATAGMPGAGHANNAGAPAFIEDSVDPVEPYAGQAVVYTLRLYYGVTLLDAALDLPAPDNGDARQIGEDERGSEVVQGRRYDVLVRHYLLQPERSGTLHVPAPVFQGRAMPDINTTMDDSLAVGSIQAAGKALEVTVRPRPAQAGDPWLPARSITLSVDPPPSAARAGEPFSLLVREDGEGVAAAQLPEIVLPAIAGAQVYPEPSSTIEHAHGGMLQSERTRRFAVVPDRAGMLQMPDLTVPWWDVARDRAAIARIALPRLQVGPGAAGQVGAASAAAESPAAGSPSVAPGSGMDTARGWRIATFTMALLLVMSLAWGWRRGRKGDAVEDGGDVGGAHGAGDAQDLRRALAQDDPAAIAQGLCQAAPAPRPRHLDELAQRLADPAQRAAVEAFDSARWRGDGRPSADVLAQLRSAFARAPRWAVPAKAGRRGGALPPLYPD